MDERTLAAYEARAPEIGRSFASVESPLRRWFAAAFPEGGRIIDVGAGVGREVAALVGEGYEAWGVEPSAGMRAVAVQQFPGLRPRLIEGHLPDGLPATLPGGDELTGRVDGIVCAAVLQHVPRNRLFDAAYALRRLLRERGRLLVSIPAERPGIDAQTRRDAAGRLFTDVTADELELLFERIGFVSVGRWSGDDALRREGFTWTTLCLELRTPAGGRPLDHLEAVLGTRERKVATYKFALVRALASIALTAPHLVTFTGDGSVRVPLDAIAERWIRYYWPVFAAPTFLPQKHGEERAGAHGLRFAPQLRALMGEFARSGGLAAFVAARRSGTLTNAAAQAHARLRRKLVETIVDGPVKHAGGSLVAPLFRHARGHVIVAAPLWRELSLTGHWVEGALLLRWGELVTRLSEGRVPAADALGVLLTDAEPERETRAARDVYLAAERLECVWTGAPLRPRDLAVDHVVPYALWRNNELWNLLPTRASVNTAKLDRLPTLPLLRARRPAILGCWELTSAAYPIRFRNEIRERIGASRVDLPRLFDALIESVEVTALQRSCQRWEP